MKFIHFQPAFLVNFSKKGWGYLQNIARDRELFQGDKDGG